MCLSLRTAAADIHLDIFPRCVPDCPLEGSADGVSYVVSAGVLLDLQGSFGTAPDPNSLGGGRPESPALSSKAGRLLLVWPVAAVLGPGYVRGGLRAKSPCKPQRTTSSARATGCDLGRPTSSLKRASEPFVKRRDKK